jgi:hypothetical protein
MNDQAFALLMAELAEIKTQNRATHELLEKHITEDMKAHRVVERHSVYFSLLGLGVPTVLAYITKKLGLY